MTMTPVLSRLLDVRRLAAIDMGETRLRQALVRIEFGFTALAGIGIGAWILSRSHAPAGALFGVWLIGIGSNYLPLSVQAFVLSRCGALEAELTTLDVRAERRRYRRRQLLLAVPFLVAVLGLGQALDRKT